MCKISASAMAADGVAVQNALDSIAAVEQPTNPDLAAKLTAAGQAVATATANWQTGTPENDINTAATAAEAILAAIPETAPYATFVAIAVAALDVLIGNLTTQSAQTANVVANARHVVNAINALPPNPYRGLIQVHRHFMQDYRSALIDRWNEQVDYEPTLGIKKL